MNNGLNKFYSKCNFDKETREVIKYYHKVLKPMALKQLKERHTYGRVSNDTSRVEC